MANVMTDMKVCFPTECASSSLTIYNNIVWLPRLLMLDAGDQAWAMVEVPLRRKKAKEFAENLIQQRRVMPQCFNRNTIMNQSLDYDPITVTITMIAGMIRLYCYIISKTTIKNQNYQT